MCSLKFHFLLYVYFSFMYLLFKSMFSEIMYMQMTPKTQISNLESSLVSSTSNTFIWISFQFSSVQFSRSVVSNSLRPHESQHSRLPCPSPTPRVHSDSRPLSQGCHPAISSSVVPFSSCPESFPMSQLFTSGGQSTAIQLSHPLLSPSPPAQSLFQ